MSGPVSEERISRFAAFVETRMGLLFSPANRGLLEQRIGSAASESGFTDGNEFVEWITRTPLNREQLEALAGHLTVGETYYFRDRETYRVLQERVIPELVSRRRETVKLLRIWSAGCATGEEPYSIAILLYETIPDISEWNITVLATDINPRFLRTAALGVYREWSFRDAPPWLREKYFIPRKDGGFEVLPAIKTMVDFRALNLAEDSYPSLFANTNAMDLVICRNVLMYFAPRVVREVVRRLSNSLLDGGWLIVSPTEIPHVQGAPFTVVMLSGVHFLRKEEAPGARSVELPTEARMEASGADLPAPRPAEPPSRMDIPPVAKNGRAESAAGLPFEERFERAKELYTHGFYEHAAESLRDLNRASPGNGKVLALLARSYANLGRLHLAREWCRKAIRADKLNPSHHFLLAAILEEEGDPREAQRSLRQALYADQNFVLAHFSLGYSFLRLGGKREGDRHLRIALSLLQEHGWDETLPESEGTTVGRLREIIGALLNGSCGS